MSERNAASEETRETELTGSFFVLLHVACSREKNNFQPKNVFKYTVFFRRPILEYCITISITLRKNSFLLVELLYLLPPRNVPEKMGSKELQQSGAIP